MILRLGQPSREQGALLLEVVLALVLFAGAAVVIGVALNASMESVEKQRFQLHASDLAVTVMSGVQLGTRPAVSGGPGNFNVPFQDYTWQLVVTPPEGNDAGSLLSAEVIVRHKPSALVYRLAQWIRPAGATNLAGASAPPPPPPGN